MENFQFLLQKEKDIMSLEIEPLSASGTGPDLGKNANRRD